MDELRRKYGLEHLLRAADLPRSTFYYQLKARALPDSDANLKSRIHHVFGEHRGRYGYRRVNLQLRQEGILINHKAVQRLMQAQGLKSLVRPKKYRSYRGAGHVAIANILDRRFRAQEPNLAWVTDVTEFNVRGEKLYLSPVMDLYNGEIVTYKTSRRPTFDLVSGMLRSAIAKLRKGEGPLIHSDQGWQYQQSGYRRLLEEKGLTQSMSRKGNCLDNAAMESFFGTLKSEYFYMDQVDTVEQLEEGIRQYIHYYNHDRIKLKLKLKLKLKGLSPVQYRTQAFSA